MAGRKRRRGNGAIVGRDLDLGRVETPSTAVDEEGHRLDEFLASLGNQGVRGEMHIRVKGELHRGVEYLLLCMGACSGIGVTAAVCHLVGAPAVPTVAVALGVGAVVLYVGRRHVTALSPHRRARRARGR